jgi:hypothetical protein
MKKSSSPFVTILKLVLALSMLLTSIPLANSDLGWLSSWSYRKSHIINSATERALATPHVFYQAFILNSYSSFTTFY